MGKRSGLRLYLLITAIVAVVAGLWFSGTLPKWLFEYKVARAGAWLPKVDQADVFLLGYLLDARSASGGFMGYPVRAQATLNEADASAVAQQWRAIPRGYQYIHLCHEPLYGLRFRQGDKIVLETTVCWNCETYDVNAPGSKYAIWEWGFDAHSTPAQILLGLLMKKVPPSMQEQEYIHKEFPESTAANGQ